jgi:hypothetical protein
MAGPTGLEPATSNVTGWRSNQLNYDPANWWRAVELTKESFVLTFLSTHNPPPVTGGHEGTRTPNFLLVREAVYQLTYVPEPSISTKLFFVRVPDKFSKKRAQLCKLSER